MIEDFIKLYNDYYRYETMSVGTSLSPTHTETILQVENLSFSWQKNKAKGNNLLLIEDAQKGMQLHNISFSLSKGETVSILGATGSGKSTLSQLLVGRIKSNAGNIYLNNSVLPLGMTLQELYTRARIQLMPQIPSLSFHPLLSIYRSLEDAFGLYQYRLQELEKSAPEYAKYTDSKARLASFVAHIQSLCELLQLDSALLHRLPSTVSGGQLQRCALIRSLLVFPQILILDEPVSHLDVPIRRAALSLIREIQQKTSIGIILISHLPEVHAYFFDKTNTKSYKLHNSELVVQ